MSLRRAFACLAAAGATCAALPLAMAQADHDPYPSRPITLITPVPPGGAVDRITRAWIACAQEHSGQPFVVQYKPGGNGVVAVAALRQAPADGYTLMVAGMSLTTIVPFVFAKQPFDPEHDIQGAAVFATSPYVLVASAQSGIRSVRELVLLAQGRPQGLDIGIPNVATPAHLLAAALAEVMGMPATLIPTGGEASGLTALLAGTVPAMIFVPGTVTGQIASGKLVPLMVFASERHPSLPGVPTVVEVTGDKSLVRTGWLGIAARTGVAHEVLRAVESWTRSCTQEADFRSALEAADIKPVFASGAEMSRRIASDILFWRPWIRRLKLVQ